MKISNIHPIILLVGFLIMLKLLGMLIFGEEGQKSSLRINTHAYDGVINDCATYDSMTGEWEGTNMDCVEKEIYN